VHKGDPCAGDTLWGRVFKADDQSILVKVERNPLWPDQSGLHYQSDERLCLERLPFIRNRELARRSLSNFITNARELVLSSVILEADFPDPARDSQTRDLCKCENEPKEDLEDSGEISDMGFAEGLDQPLNSFQAAAIARALESDPYHLIHGPPGAGKTRVVSRLVRKCLDNGERVLLACPTNVALDRALDSLVDLGIRNFVRMGARSSCSPSLLAKLEKHRRNCNFIDDVAAKHNRIGKALDFLKSVPLVAATCHQVMSNSFFYNKRFDRVIIDEAGQLDEPTALAAIALGDRFVLSGDHQQLPPIVSSMAPSQDDVKGWGLDRSLFERLFLHGPADRISSLNIQYRMNAQIQSIVSNVFYNGLLRAAADVSARKLAMESHDRADPQLMNILDPACPVVFVDIQGPDSGKVSPEEALAVACITSELVRLGVGPQRIGVITPYRAQQALIRDYLLRLGSFDPGPTVNTVDRFQGGEREVIILSLSRSDNVTSFLADRKRLNVSLSRARSKLILLGRHTTIVSHSLFKDVLYGVPRVTFRPSESMRRCCEREERPIAGKEGELED
jgi:DNA replication ATP-dependent helicase Dna2